MVTIKAWYVIATCKYRSSGVVKESVTRDSQLIITWLIIKLAPLVYDVCALESHDFHGGRSLIPVLDFALLRWFLPAEMARERGTDTESCWYEEENMALLVGSSYGLEVYWCVYLLQSLGRRFIRFVTVWIGYLLNSCMSVAYSVLPLNWPPWEYACLSFPLSAFSLIS